MMDAGSTLLTAGRIGPDDLVSEVLAAYPKAAFVFTAYRMACPGCVMAPFMTIRDAAQSYDLDPDRLMADLERGTASPDRFGAEEEEEVEEETG